MNARQVPDELAEERAFMKGDHSMDQLRRSSEERIERLHTRAREIRRQSIQRRLAACGGMSAAFAFVLFSVIQQKTNLSQSIMQGQFVGSSMVSESTGGYVLTAVIAFLGGVVLTALIYRYRKRQ